MIFVRKYLVLAVGLPLAVASASALVADLIPGCTIDTGSGASGCGSMGFFLALGMYGGACVTLLGGIGLVPVLIGHLAARQAAVKTGREGK